MSVESITSDALQQLIGSQCSLGNGRTTLESFGFFLEDYVIQGAEITLDTRNPRRFTLSEAIISIDDGLYRVSTETLTLKGRGTTYFVDFTVKNGFVANVQHPSGSYLALWEINTNAAGNIVSTVDMRGEMGYVRFREEIQGIISDQLIVDEQHITDQAVGTTKIKDMSVTTNKYADKSITPEKISDEYNTDRMLYSGSMVGPITTTDAIDSVYKQLTESIITGDSSLEAAAARYDSVTGITYPMLGSRLDSASELLKTHSSDIGILEQEKVNKTEVNVLLGGKRDKSEPIHTVDYALGSITPEKLSQEVKNMMTGSTPVDNANPTDGSVSKKKLDQTISSEWTRFHYDDLNRIFMMNDSSYNQSNVDISVYNQCFGAVKKLVLKGFDSTKKTKLRVIARNHASFKYRFIFSQFIENGWVDMFDAGVGFAVTEVTNGLTPVTHTIGSKTVEMLVDYSAIANTTSFAELLDGARLVVRNECFYENSTAYVNEKLNGDIARIDAQMLTIKNKDLYVKKTGSNYKITFAYGSGTMTLDFDKLGINELIHPKRIYKNDILWYTLNTDWISPYGLTANNNPVSNFNGTVGGNHGTVGGGGFPTARNVSTELYADGKQVMDGESVSCDKVVLVVKNYIAASNTINVDTGSKRDSVEELVTYIVTSGNIEVYVQLTALEDVQFTYYTGIQMTTDMFVGKAYFMPDNGVEFNPDGVRHNSSAYPGFNGDRMIYHDQSEVITSYLNLEYGLGNRSQTANGQVPFYLSEFRKLYGHLVNGMPITVQNGKTLAWSGGYSFTQKQSIQNEKVIHYPIQITGSEIYCIDLLSATPEMYLQLPDRYVGGIIDILDKSNSVTVDRYVTGKGLKLSSSGFGQVKFKLGE